LGSLFGIILLRFKSNSNATFAGHAKIEGTVTNNGTINANAAGQTLFVSNGVTNNGLLEATGGGISRPLARRSRSKTEP
jgi:hypothetical protein